MQKQADWLLTLHEAAQLVPGRGRRRVHAATLARWIAKGVIAPDGRRVRLRAVKLGPKYLTSRRWIEEFGAAQMPTFSDASDSPPTDRQRDLAAERAGNLLAELGA